MVNKLLRYRMIICTERPPVEFQRRPPPAVHSFANKIKRSRLRRKCRLRTRIRSTSASKPALCFTTYNTARDINTHLGGDRPPARSKNGARGARANAGLSYRDDGRGSPWERARTTAASGRFRKRVGAPLAVRTSFPPLHHHLP